MLLTYWMGILICLMMATTTTAMNDTDHSHQIPLMAIDALRVKYLLKEQNLYSVVQRKGTQSKLSLLRIVYNAYLKFVNDFNMQDVFIAQKYEIIDDIDWRELREQLQDIEDIFIAFKKTMQMAGNILHGNRGLLKSLEILKQMDKITATFRFMEEIMINQTLYDRAMLMFAHNICQSQQSPQLFTYSLYADIALIDLKAYIMIQFAQFVLEINGRANYNTTSRPLRVEYVRRTENALILVTAVMREAERAVWRCDPMQHVAGETYDEVSYLLQGYVENQYNFIYAKCNAEECEDYQETKVARCKPGELCEQQPQCHGVLYECRKMQSRSQICQAARTDERRRYEYIINGNERLGEPGKHCKRSLNRANAFKQLMDILISCDYCFCYCDEVNIKSERYFSLRDVMANVRENFVITGVRLVKQQRVFHWQIQQGQLLPFGIVNSTSIEWRDVDTFKIYEVGVHEGRDFHMLNYSARTIDLDELHTNQRDLVLTGVRFQLFGRSLQLAVQYTVFDFVSGKLQMKVSFWQSNTNSETSATGRRRISLVDLDAPTRLPVPSIIVSQHNDYVEFTPSSVTKDVAQRTLPFIDVQTVVPQPQVPLQGVGLYLKRRNGNGGFLAPKVYTYDFTSHINHQVN